MRSIVRRKLNRRKRTEPAKVWLQKKFVEQQRTGPPQEGGGSDSLGMRGVSPWRSRCRGRGVGR